MTQLTLDLPLAVPNLGEYRGVGAGIEGTGAHRLAADLEPGDRDLLEMAPSQPRQPPIPSGHAGTDGGSRDIERSTRPDPLEQVERVQEVEKRVVERQRDNTTRVILFEDAQRIRDADEPPAVGHEEGQMLLEASGRNRSRRGGLRTVVRDRPIPQDR